MQREITQRELRNESGAIIRAIDSGESFVVTRNGVPVAEMTPVRRRKSTSRAAIVKAFKNAPSIDAKRFFARHRRHSRLRSDDFVNDVRCGILDRCVFIDVDKVEVSALPDESYVTTITLAELAAGPHAAHDLSERALRQDRLHRVEMNFEALPFDASAACAYGR